MCTVKEAVCSYGRSKRINISSLEKENCSGELVDQLADGLELKSEAKSVEKMFVTDAGLVIKILKGKVSAE